LSCLASPNYFFVKTKIHYLCGKKSTSGLSVYLEALREQAH